MTDWQSLVERLPQFDCVLFSQEQEVCYRQLVEQGWVMPVVYPIAPDLADIPAQIEEAIARFVRQQIHQHQPNRSDTADSQYKLATKLQERLGYLGVFYKRSPDQFLRNLPLPKGNSNSSSCRISTAPSYLLTLPNPTPMSTAKSTNLPALPF